jgi:hypothetical protein
VCFNAITLNVVISLELLTYFDHRAVNMRSSRLLAIAGAVLALSVAEAAGPARIVWSDAANCAGSHQTTAVLGSR